MKLSILSIILCVKMSLKDIKEQQITLVNENLFEKGAINNKEVKNIENTVIKKNGRRKNEKDKMRNCVSMYFTDDEYNELVKAKGDVAQSLFCRKIVMAAIHKYKI